VTASVAAAPPSASASAAAGPLVDLRAPSSSTRVAYAGPALALAVVGVPLYVFVPKFYSDVVGVPIAALGTILAAVRLFDAVLDPPIGWLSDQTRTRLGRRRPWLLFGVVPLALCMVALLVPPALDPAGATLWFTLTIFAVFLFWTVVTVPYEALGPELCFDHHDRTALLGLRDGALLLGTVLAVSSPYWIGSWIDAPAGPTGERARMAAIAAVYAPLLVVLCIACVAVVREPVAAERVASPRPSLRVMLENRPFRILLASYTVSALGSSLPATLILYYVQYVLGAASAELYLFVYFAVGIALLPAWIAASRCWGKRNAWIAAMAVNTCAFTGVFFLGPGQTLAYGFLVSLSGVGLGGTLALPSAMQADVIDYDELLSGQRREGQYIGIWSIARKLAGALGVGAALAALGVVGYVPNGEQSPQVVTTLRVLYALVPSLCNVAGMAMALSYPIDEARHREILEAIAARRREQEAGGGGATGPSLAAEPA
jgi:glycoside/pentoside/hexuronide:cation symporter, GPH family